MNKYTIYCTEEQTRKALELGAPINTEINYTRTGSQFEGIYNDGKTFYYLPTAEQILNWLEEHKLQIVITVSSTDRWIPIIYETSSSHPLYIGENTDSRVKATIAAIDAALEYLSDNKKNK